MWVVGKSVHFAPPKKPSNDPIPTGKTKKHWLCMESKWCRIRPPTVGTPPQPTKHWAPPPWFPRFATFMKRIISADLVRLHGQQSMLAHTSPPWEGRWQTGYWFGVLLCCILLGCWDFNCLPTHGFSIKPLKVLLF